MSIRSFGSDIKVKPRRASFEYIPKSRGLSIVFVNAPHRLCLVVFGLNMEYILAGLAQSEALSRARSPVGRHRQSAYSGA